MCKARKGQAGRAALVEKIVGTSPNFGLQGGQRDGRATLVGKVGKRATQSTCATGNDFQL